MLPPMAVIGCAPADQMENLSPPSKSVSGVDETGNKMEYGGQLFHTFRFEHIAGTIPPSNILGIHR